VGDILEGDWRSAGINIGLALLPFVPGTLDNMLDMARHSDDFADLFRQAELDLLPQNHYFANPVGNNNPKTPRPPANIVRGQDDALTLVSPDDPDVLLGLATLDKDGGLTLFFQFKDNNGVRIPTSAGGEATLDAVVAEYGKDNITQIYGVWAGTKSDNYNKFVKEYDNFIIQGLHPDDAAHEAAKLTWTAEQAKRLGYDTEVIVTKYDFVTETVNVTFR